MSIPQPNPFTREKLTQDVLNEWQNVIDTAAKVFAVPAGVITRVDGDQIELLLSSETPGNPYTVGYTTHYPDSGWYCERTLKSRRLNLIPDAREDSDWKANPAAVSLNMVSYIGLPIHRPDGGDFGTVCFLDNKANPHNELHIKMLEMIKRMLELSLRVIADKELINRQERLFNDLSRIYPICSYCKKVRGKKGAWVEVERYIGEVSGALPTHGICPECMADLEKKWPQLAPE
ncbi:MAG: GAF domain-containing protein [Opitutaceae bacterium]|nr:GAF domain-containing protein [Opitutaceae bacterium]